MTTSSYTEGLVDRARDPGQGILELASAPILIERLPQPVNLSLYQGDDFALTIAVDDLDGQPADLSGASVRSQIRPTADADQISGVLTPVIVDNEITLYLTGQTSSSLPLRTVYDVEMTDAQDRITTLIAGTITLTAEVTRG